MSRYVFFAILLLASLLNAEEKNSDADQLFISFLSWQGHTERERVRSKLYTIIEDDPAQGFQLIENCIADKKTLANIAINKLKFTEQDAYALVESKIGLLIRRAGEMKKKIYLHQIVGILCTTDSPSLKCACIYALGQLGIPDARFRIREFIKDQDAGIRANAVVALGLLSDSEFIENASFLLRDEQFMISLSAAKIIAERNKIELPKELEISINSKEEQAAYRTKVVEPFLRKIEDYIKNKKSSGAHPKVSVP